MRPCDLFKPWPVKNSIQECWDVHLDPCPDYYPLKSSPTKAPPSSHGRSLATHCRGRKLAFSPRMCEVEYGFLWFCWRADLGPPLHYLFSHRTQWFLVRYRCVDSISPKWTEEWNLIWESHENIATNISICWCFPGKLTCEIEYTLPPKIDLFVLTVGVKYFLLSLLSGFLHFTFFSVPPLSFIGDNSIHVHPLKMWKPNKKENGFLAVSVHNWFCNGFLFYSICRFFLWGPVWIIFHVFCNISMMVNLPTPCGPSLNAFFLYYLNLLTIMR